MSDESSKVVKIPPSDVWLGSCPICGKYIWKSYQVHPSTEHLKAVYKCIECKELIDGEQIIPF